MYRIRNENLRRELDEYTTRDLWLTLERERAEWLSGIPDRLNADLHAYWERERGRDDSDYLW